MTSTHHLETLAAAELGYEQLGYEQLGYEQLVYEQRRSHGRWTWAALALVGAAIACQGEPTDFREPADTPPVTTEPVEYPAAAVVDLGSDDRPRQMLEGFSPPERVGARFASWSEGERSTVGVNLRGGARDYLVAFLAEPYHRLGGVAVNLSLNGRPLGEAQLAPGWRAYQLSVSGERVSAGRNTLSLQYSKTGRPSDLDPQSTDVRALSVRFDQIQIAPIGERVQLGFGSNDALALAALGEGWARDPSDRGTGTWTIADRATLTFHLTPPEAKPGGPSYPLTLTARAPRGIAERRVALTLNGAPLGSLVFTAKKSRVTVEVPSERLHAKNELAFEFTGLQSPAELHSDSKDARLLGLRVFELSVAPRDSSPVAPSGSSPVAPSDVASPAPQGETVAKQPVAEAAPIE